MRPEFVDEFVLSFEVGAVKPDAAIFETALARLGVEAAHAVMVGDSDEADGGARAIGCGFILVDPLPTAQRHDGLRNALADYGVQYDGNVPAVPAHPAAAGGSSREQGFGGAAAARRAGLAT